MNMSLFRIWAGIVCVAIADVGETCEDETCDAGQSSPFLLQATIKNNLKHEGGLHEIVKHYQGGKGDDVDTVDKNSKEAPTVTCEFTGDNVVDSVYYNGMDVTHAVTGTLDNWRSKKIVTVTSVSGAYFVVTAHNLETGGVDHCKTGGFSMFCDNGVTTKSVGWEAHASTVIMDDVHRKGQGASWIAPGVSTSGFNLEGHSQDNVGKICGTSDGKYTAYRMQLYKEAPTVTCEFTGDNVVDSVYYNGIGLTHVVTGPLNNWRSKKTVTVTSVSGAYFVVSVHNSETGVDHCKTGGFSMFCDNGVTTKSVGWEAHASTDIMDEVYKKGQGGCASWVAPNASTSGYSLEGHSHDNVGKICGTPDGKYTAYRVQLYKEVPTAME